jgi:tRNA threonylcarbamoyladenosine biosynthesis protein TsaE
MTETITTTSEQDTAALGATFAKTLSHGDIVLLTGDLGAGKSVFCRAIVRTLMEQPELDVPSPTFTLVQTYDTPTATLWHFDLYRLKDAEEIYEIGWEDALSGGVVLVEWPDRLGGYAPQKSIHVNIAIAENQRTITINRPT